MVRILLRCFKRISSVLPKHSNKLVSTGKLNKDKGGPNRSETFIPSVLSEWMFPEEKKKFYIHEMKSFHTCWAIIGCLWAIVFADLTLRIKINHKPFSSAD